MYKLAVLAVVIAAASAGIVPASLPLGYAGLNTAALPLNYGINAALPYGINAAVAPAAVAAPLNYAAVAPVAAPVAAVAPVAKTYAVPAPRLVEEAPIVEQVLEKVEQHGYSVRY